MDIKLNLKSSRSKKAALAVTLNRRVVDIVLMLAVAGLAVLGLLVIWLESSSGWLLLGLAWIFVMVYLWKKWELQTIPAIKNSSSIDGYMQSDLLGILVRTSKKITPKVLAEAVMQVPGGQFYAARLGIGPSFLSHLASESESEVANIFHKAGTLHSRRGEDVLSAADVTAAIILSAPNVEAYLAQLQLSKDDVLAAAEWYAHLVKLIDYHKKRRPTGGIARDWTFGFTPLLERLGRNISQQVQRGGLLNTDLETHQDALARIITILSGDGHQNVNLIGRLGVGKTTIVHALAEKMIVSPGELPTRLRYRQVIALDAGTLISRVRGRGELEELMNRVMVEAYTAKNIILFLDDAQMFFEDGVGSVDIGHVLEPVITGGVLPIILSMDEQRWLQISRRYPTLSSQVNRITVEEPKREDTIRVMQDQALLLEFRYKVTYMFQALTEAYHMSERYVYEQAMPGKAVKLLEAAAEFAEGGLVTAVSVKTAVERAYGVKVAGTATQTEKQDLLNLEDKIHERMINQTKAVKVVSDALRRSQAGIRNQHRPAGTFLFLGPTGVGKTELSKALAAVYFGGEEKIVRIDMNEFVSPDDVARLLADGSIDEHSLAAQVAKRPFSVVLLDEIEKAHPNVINTLLQMLDEGVLRDIKNRPINFRDAIVIATSNAGAQEIRAAIKEGIDLESIEEKLIDQMINSGQFRPEFINRFDEVVVFRPLEQNELRQVVDLILDGVNKNLALQQISVEVDDSAKDWLVQNGNDPQLGARPMRRIVQRTVENIIAKRMLNGEVAPGSTVKITVDDLQKES